MFVTELVQIMVDRVQLVDTIRLILSSGADDLGVRNF